MRYRKIPVEIEAMQLPPGGMNEDVSRQADISQWLYEGGLTPGDDYVVSEQGWAIKTLEGTMLADYGDWIIKGIEGEFYPCKPNIFRMTYEAV